jgi:hypothetical protein
MSPRLRREKIRSACFVAGPNRFLIRQLVLGFKNHPRNATDLVRQRVSESTQTRRVINVLVLISHIVN